MITSAGQYEFHHRHTNRHGYSRQACAEKLVRTEDGRFLQAEVTSCGLNHGPLKGVGRYEARIACNLWSKEGTGRYDTTFSKWKFRKHPYFTQTGKDREKEGDQYIANMRDGSVAGFKYFDFREVKPVMEVEVSGKGKGVLVVSTDPEGNEMVSKIPVVAGKEPKSIRGSKKILAKAVKPLYVRYCGSGYINFHGFSLIERDLEKD